MGYLAGWNMPGYMPETNPEYFEQWDDAHSYINHTVERFMDDDFDQLAWTRTEETNVIEQGLNEKWDPVRISLMADSPFTTATSDLDLVFWIVEADPIPN